MAEVVLHIGLHKTATGTLQRQYFPACRDCRLLTAARPQVRRFVHLVTRRDPLYFDPEEALAALDGELDPHRLNLLSNESLSGPPYAGVIEGGLDHRLPVLENLKACFPEARVVLVLRRQDDLARSLYRQYLRAGGTRDVRRFYGLNEAADAAPPLMPLDRFRFGPFVAAVAEAFPAGLLTLPYEEFVDDQPAFLDKLNRFLGVASPPVELRMENATRLGGGGMEMSRWLNHLFRSSLNPAGLIPSPRRRSAPRRRARPVSLLHDHWPWPGRAGRRIQQAAGEILARVSDDNQRLDRALLLGLERYGYY